MKITIRDTQHGFTYTPRPPMVDASEVFHYPTHEQAYTSACLAYGATCKVTRDSDIPYSDRGAYEGRYTD